MTLILFVCTRRHELHVEQSQPEVRGLLGEEERRVMEKEDKQVVEREGREGRSEEGLERGREKIKEQVTCQFFISDSHKKH